MKKGCFLLLALLLHLSVYATLPPITGALAICPGSNTTLSNTTPGGTWSSANPAVATLIGTGVIYGAGIGTATISYTVGSDVATAVVTVVPTPAPPGGGAVCVGTSTPFYSAPAGGMWSSSAPGIATVDMVGSVTGIAPGTTTITYATSMGCVSSTIVTVGVPPAPITGPTSFCVGSSTTLSSTPGGGTWVSSNAAVALPGSSSGIVTGFAAGTTGISYVLPTGCFASTIVTVMGAPAIMGITTVCTGLTTTLSDFFGGGTWSGGSPSIATINSAGVVTGVAPGSTTIYCTNTCGTSPMPINVINSVPAIIGSSSLCVGSSFSLSNSAAGGSWSSSATSVATISPASSNTGMLYGVGTGTALISYSLGTCGSATFPINVFASPTPITGPSSLCAGTTATYGNATTGGTWSSYGTLLPIDVTSGIATSSAGSSGSTTVYYTLPSGCYVAKAISVNPVPAISGSTGVCVGGTTTLTSSSAVSYTDGTPAVIGVSMAGYYSPAIVSGISLGTGIITFTTPGSSCTTTTTINTTSSCTGTPAGGTVLGPAAVYGGVPAALSLSGASVGCGISCQWQSSPDNTTWSNISGATNTTYNATISSPYYYRCVLTCASTSLSGTSSSIFLDPTYSIASHSVISPADTACNASHFYLSANGYSGSLSVTTYFGDGLSSTQSLMLGGGVYSAHTYHYYTLPGTYSIKQVLKLSGTAIDSATYTYTYNFCRSLPIRLFKDNNTNCLFDAGDNFLMTPATVRVDSNGVPVDTISCTSGFYYKALGGTGTIYSFQVISSPGLVVSCPSTGIIYDTIDAYVNTYTAKYFGLSCSGTPTFDLAVSASVRAGRHSHRTTILVTNNQCFSATPTVTISNFKYTSPGAMIGYLYPTPTFASTNTITWTLPPMAGGSSQTLDAWFEKSTPWFTPGDTTQTTITVSPTTGDADTSNNIIIRTDTITASYDPNDIAVSPQGYVLPCTQLHYTVRFENDGNDTAHNIYVLDTLPSHIDPSSLIVEDASAPMFVSVINDGVRNIAKFDFPNINLPDSSHHGLCTGLFHFNVKVRGTAPDGADIMNRVGIYFDDNEVVMTNQVNNPVGVPPINGTSALCAGTTATLYNAYAGGIWSTGGTHASVTGGVVSGTSAGTAMITYTVSNACTSRAATKTMTVETTPGAMSITGMPNICTGTITTLTPSVSGGSWTSGNPAIATITGPGMVLGNASGTATISYTVANSCGSGVATRVVTVAPLPTAGTITGTPSVCVGAITTLGATAPGGIWSASNTNASVSGGIVTGNSSGTVTISYIVGNACGAAAAVKVVTVNTVPSGIISGAATVCVGTSASMSGTFPGGTWTASNANITISPTGGVATGITAGTVYITYAMSNACGSATAETLMTVHPLPDAGTLSGSSSVCVSGTTTLTPAITGGTWGASNTNASVIAGTVTGSTAGTVTISYTVTNMCGSAVATFPVTVDALPVAGIISGSASVCESAAITLSGPASGGIWTTSNTNASVAGGVVTGISAGAVTVSYAVTNLCGTAVAVHAITVDPLPVAGSLSGTSAVCVGATTVLTPTIAGGTWASGDVSASVSGGTVTGLSAGTASISYSITNGCGTDYAIHPITVNPLPEAGTISATATVCVGATITVSSTATGGTWVSQYGKTTIAGNVITGQSSGSDDLLYIVSNSCGSDTAIASITVNPCINGITAIIKPEVQIFPNPASDKLLINTNGLRYDRYSIINNLGQTIAEHPLDGNETTIIIRSLTPGIYTIRLSGEDGSITKKFVHIE